MSVLDTIFDDGKLDGHDLDLMEELLMSFYNSSELGYGPRFKELNWTTEFKKDMLKGKGFIVKAKAFDKFKNREMDGIHSPRFGSTWTDEEAFAERYRCKCGMLMGKVYEGEICKECNTEVKFTDVDLDIYAWMVLLNYYIIQPAMFKKIQSFIGKKALGDIIEFKYQMNKDGYFNPPEQQNSRNPFFGIGLYEFQERFEEIMEYYRKRKKKDELYDNIMQNKDKIFTKYIPVYSSVLRQVFITDEDYSYTKIDRKFNSLYGNIVNLNKERELNVTNREKINKNLFKAQSKINEIYSLIFAMIDQKEGHIRENVLGGRINFSARNVIIPDASLRSYQVKLPYLTFLELYQQEIINLIVKINGLSFTDATQEWFSAQTEFNPKVYEIMNYLLRNTKHKVKVLINRNPTINFGSFLCMEVAEVKSNYDDLTCSLPVQILAPLNADFDGDVINIVALKSNEFKKELNKIFNPRNSLFINRNDGLFNEDCGLMKDQLIGLFQFNNI